VGVGVGVRGHPPHPQTPKPQSPIPKILIKKLNYFLNYFYLLFTIYYK